MLWTFNNQVCAKSKKKGGHTCSHFLVQLHAKSQLHRLSYLIVIVYAGNRFGLSYIYERGHSHGAVDVVSKSASPLEKRGIPLGNALRSYFNQRKQYNTYSSHNNKLYLKKRKRRRSCSDLCVCSVSIYSYCKNFCHRIGMISQKLQILAWLISTSKKHLKRTSKVQSVNAINLVNSRKLNT